MNRYRGCASVCLVAIIMLLTMSIGAQAVLPEGTGTWTPGTIGERAAMGAIQTLKEKQVWYRNISNANPRLVTDETVAIFDCSSFVFYVYWEYAGIRIPTWTFHQLGPVEDPEVRSKDVFTETSALRPGDLVFFDTNQPDGEGDRIQRRAGHVGIYIGAAGEGEKGQFIHCGDAVMTSSQTIQSSCVPNGTIAGSLPNSPLPLVFEGHLEDFLHGVVVNRQLGTCLKVVTLEEYKSYGYAFLAARRITGSYEVQPWSNFQHFVAAPTAFRAEAIAPTQIALRWNYTAGGERGFRIHRRAEGEDRYAQVCEIKSEIYGKMRSEGGDGFLWIDENVLPATTYHYRVFTFNQAYCGPEMTNTSVEVAVSTPKADVVPVQPTTDESPVVLWPEASNTAIRKAYEEDYLRFERSKTPISWATFCEYSRPFAPRPGIGWNDEEAWSASGLADTPEFIEYAKRNPISLIARCLFAENRNITGDVGQRTVRATATVISNRARVSWDGQNTLSAVILAPTQFSCMRDPNTGARNPVLKDGELALWCYCVYVADHLYSGTNRELWTEIDNNFFFFFDLADVIKGTVSMPFFIATQKEPVPCTIDNAVSATHYRMSGSLWKVITKPIKIGSVVFFHCTNQNVPGWWEQEAAPPKAGPIPTADNSSSNPVSDDGTAAETNPSAGKTDGTGCTETAGAPLEPLPAAPPETAVSLYLPTGTDANLVGKDGLTPLMRAVRDTNDPGLINALVAAGANVNAKDKNGSTALSIAVQQGVRRVEAVQALISAGSDINMLYGSNWTVLMSAVHHNNDPELVRTLVAAGADANARNKNGETALFIGIRRGNRRIEAIKELLAAGADVNAVLGDGHSLLLDAVKCHDSPELIKVLVEAGADVNGRNKNGETALFLATVSGNERFETIRALLAAGADPDIPYAGSYAAGWTPLMEAMRSCNNTEIVRTILAAGADINARNKNGETALMLAMMQDVRRVEVIRVLIEAGADLNARNKNGETALMLGIAEAHDHIEATQTLLSAGADANAKSGDNLTPLMRVALIHNRPELVSILVTAGADVNARNKNGETALVLAVMQDKRRVEVVQALIEAGADVNAVSADGLTPLMKAVVKHNSPELVGVLASAGAHVNVANAKGETPLAMGVIQGDDRLMVVQALIEAGADVDVVSSDGLTPLMKAAVRHNKPELVRALVAAAANVNAVNRNGETALSMAVVQDGDRFMTIKALIEAGADVNIASADSLTPLMKAVAKRNCPDLVRMLVAAGADVNSRNKSGETALVRAIVQDSLRLETVLALVEVAADVNAIPWDGWTPLMKAVWTHNSPELVKALARAGASVNATNNDGDTALAIAVSRDRDRLAAIRALIEVGASVNSVSNNGSTPLMKAVWTHNNPELVKTLVGAGAHINARDLEGRTALVLAIIRSGSWYPRLETIQALIACGADVNSISWNGLTPLMWATSQNKDRKIIEALVAAGAVDSSGPR